MSLSGWTLEELSSLREGKIVTAQSTWNSGGFDYV